MQPELRAVERALQALARHPTLRSVIDNRGRVRLTELDLEQIAELLGDEHGQLLLMAAAGLNRTTLRSGTTRVEAQIVPAPLRRAHVVRSQLPPDADFSTLVELAVAQRRATLERSSSAQTETLFKDRLAFEGLPIRMGRGAWTSGLLIDRRKPDGVYPDPASGQPPELYLEVKKINRPRDDIQKRLYEIAEVSLEVKFLYGGLRLRGLHLSSLLADADRPSARQSLRKQVVGVRPVVVALLLCGADDIPYVARYRERAEAFVDRVFLADEIEACVDYLAEIVPREPG